ncbi:oxygen-independent coproporphyrinogen-3 oxidase [Rhodovulum imhoffii]|uniref:Coproporphyrinogen-III oxidase n=1 Tax=Rhodovulum imhoffii TaxID=365340 RepID=A0A2T5BPF2_9RHOB|nr:oxygen-independent coproporphyrinogen III oxidase [Rhodovulum imhoffii]MBK5932633.1 oxygen-independent coproporphyrinogen III oxidase [Rhodovulum imhoffii]PTN00913.1 oxygen-independent coproporphyrinogen-3 oxidase [Rhodovulum imhoffii]
MSTESQLTRLGLFDARVPRYTSYPTAPHFSASVDDGDFTGWIDQIAPGSRISLYIHVPFCRRLCWFCACRTQGTRSDAPVRAYLDTLKAEIGMLARRLPEGVTLSRLHWGGGTPTLLTPDMMRELADTIFSAAPLHDDGEFSVEIDPNEIDEARLDVLAAAGMNRASIGIQDFDPQIQSVIGRIQSYDVTRDAVDLIRSRGIDSLNADILYGLPHQSNERIAESVQKLLSLSPDRVALYGYAHVPWMARRQSMIPADALPTPEARLKLYETAKKLFLWDNYREIGIDHFARAEDGLAVALDAGKLRRNFQGYTDDTAPVLIGLGASSISKFPQGYAQNLSGTSDYTARIRDGRFATGRGHTFTEDDNLRARMIEALMCDFRIDAAEITETFDISKARLNEMFQEVADGFPGFIDLSNEGFAIVEEGRPLTRMIARGFDAYDLSKAGHSSAI